MATPTSPRNVYEAGEGFNVLAHTSLSQTAALHLRPGGQTSSALNTHEKSDQLLVVLRGELTAHVKDETTPLKEGDSLIVPAGTPHKFVNDGDAPAIAFTAYTPPEY